MRNLSMVFVMALGLLLTWAVFSPSVLAIEQEVIGAGPCGMPCDYTYSRWCPESWFCGGQYYRCTYEPGDPRSCKFYEFTCYGANPKCYTIPSYHCTY
jgi:hypothetical protein